MEKKCLAAFVAFLKLTFFDFLFVLRVKTHSVFNILNRKAEKIVDTLQSPIVVFLLL